MVETIPGEAGKVVGAQGYIQQSLQWVERMVTSTNTDTLPTSTSFIHTDTEEDYSSGVPKKCLYSKNALGVGTVTGSTSIHNTGVVTMKDAEDIDASENREM
uniref:Methylthioribose-1-phosphate isomerase n=1 Tax=Lygus hesperus TaxID=30085 RepID=A0A0A9WIJ8_LYGHE